jgi:predicted phosphatase
MLTEEQSDNFCHWSENVDKLIKLLKIKAFILEKFLDTAFRRPIRFRQKVLMVFFETPLELFSLEKRRPSCCRTAFSFLSVASLHTAGERRSGIVSLCSWGTPLVATRASRRKMVDKICRFAQVSRKRRSGIVSLCSWGTPLVATRASRRKMVDKICRFAQVSRKRRSGIVSLCSWGTPLVATRASRRKMVDKICRFAPHR